MNFDDIAVALRKEWRQSTINSFAHPGVPRSSCKSSTYCDESTARRLGMEVDGEPLRTHLERDRRTRASCPVSQLLRLGRIVGRVSVFYSEGPLGVDLHDYLAPARERVVVHVLRQIDEAACAKLFGFRFVELVPHSEAEVA